MFQIHAPSWDKKAQALGYGDYKTDPEDNAKLAKYIYDQAGNWSDWVCAWDKLAIATRR